MPDLSITCFPVKESHDYVYQQLTLFRLKNKWSYGGLLRMDHKSRVF